MIERYLTTEQVANILQVHPLTILKFIKQGKLQGVKIGRIYRIQESEVKAFLSERAIDNGKRPEKRHDRVEEQSNAEVKTEYVIKTEKAPKKDSDEPYYLI